MFVFRSLYNLEYVHATAIRDMLWRRRRVHLSAVASNRSCGLSCPGFEKAQDR